MTPPAPGQLRTRRRVMAVSDCTTGGIGVSTLESIFPLAVERYDFTTKRHEEPGAGFARNPLIVRLRAGFTLVELPLHRSFNA